VDSKYGSSWGGWCFSERVGTYGVSFWNNIRRGWEKFRSHTRLEEEDGSKVRFWQDLWYGDMPLRMSF
jgi:hypothetical protein